MAGTSRCPGSVAHQLDDVETRGAAAEAEVGDDDVVGLGAEQLGGVFEGGAGADGRAHRLERQAHRLGDIGFVVDVENTQAVEGKGGARGPFAARRGGVGGRRAGAAGR